ncbi:MAG: flagellar biosynthetic protein FliO [Oscillospiraceae bacterium]|nr:flagellar biosynthetic protein FliO [Oscillospiraceae bacterium]
MPPEQVIIFIIGTIVILFGAYYVTYFVGMKASGQTRAGMKNRNIRLLDRYAVSRDKQFCVIEVAGKVYILGVTNHTMTLLDTIDAEEYAELTQDDEEATPWNMTPVGQYGNKLTKKLVAFVAEKTGKTKKKEEKPEDKENPYKTTGSDFSESIKKAKKKTPEDD